MVPVMPAVSESPQGGGCSEELPGPWDPVEVLGAAPEPHPATPAQASARSTSPLPNLTTLH